MGRAPCGHQEGLKKGPWTYEEDQLLITYIQQHGHGSWSALPKKAGLLRCGKSCRLRWTNYLRPDIKRGKFSLEEERTIVELHAKLGNRWSVIASRLPGRTDNEIKNYWNTHLKKHLLEMGIDPITHTARSDMLFSSSSVSSVSSILNHIAQWQMAMPETEAMFGGENLKNESFQSEIEPNVQNLSYQTLMRIWGSHRDQPEGHGPGRRMAFDQDTESVNPNDILRNWGQFVATQTEDSYCISNSFRPGCQSFVIPELDVSQSCGYLNHHIRSPVVADASLNSTSYTLNNYTLPFLKIRTEAALHKIFENDTLQTDQAFHPERAADQKNCSSIITRLSVQDNPITHKLPSNKLSTSDYIRHTTWATDLFQESNANSELQFLPCNDTEHSTKLSSTNKWKEPINDAEVYNAHSSTTGTSTYEQRLVPPELLLEVGDNTNPELEKPWISTTTESNLNLTSECSGESDYWLNILKLLDPNGLPTHSLKISLRV